MQKKKYNKHLAAAMSCSMIVSNIVPAFAATQTITENSDVKTEVTYSKASSFSVTIPKNITLGNDKQSDYSVKVEGDISSDQEVSVVPVDTVNDIEGTNFYMKDQSTTNPKEDVLTTITHTKSEWNFQEVADSYEETNNSVSAPNLTSGEWKGTFNFEINTNILEPEMPSINGFIDGGTYDTGTSIAIKDNETLKINDEIINTTDNKYTFNEEGNFKVSVSDDSGNEVSVNITIKHTHTYVDGVCTGCGDTKSATPKATIDNLIDGGTYPTETAVSVPKNAILKVNNDNVSLSNNKYTFDEEGTYDVVLSDEETETSLQINISDTKGSTIYDLVNNGTYSEKTSINVADDETLSINGTEIELTDGKYTFDGEGSYEVTTTDKDGNKVIVVVVIQHSCYYSEKITKEATYTEDGEKTYTCIKCKDTITEVLPKLVDTTAPSGSITVADNVWRSLLNTITFNTFFRDTQDIVISAEDNESGIKEIAYYLSDSQIDEANLPSLSWNEYTDKVAISPNNNYVIYARIKDNQDNVTYINSDGIVLDSTKPIINGLVNGNVYPEGTVLTISEDESLSINNENIELTNNTYTFNEVGEYEISVSNTSGGNTTIHISIEHDYVSTIIRNATCGEKGLVRYTCSNCNNSYMDTIETTGEHNIVDNVCTVCGMSLVAPAGEHNDWGYTLDKINKTITLNYYNNSSKKNVTVYGKYEIDGTIYDTRIKSNTDESSIYLFNILNKIETVKFNDDVDTSTCTNMSGMFRCPTLKSIDFGNNFDTSNVTDMSNMFNTSNSSLTEIKGIENWDTSKVTNMSNMFTSCENLSELDLNKWDTSSVENMYGMFWNCESLTNLDVSNFNTENVNNMAGMFYNCLSLKNLDVSSFDTSNVTSMGSMFFICKALTDLDLSNFNTSKVTSMDSMFAGCESLTSLDIRSFNTSKVTSMNGMFSQCYKLSDILFGNEFDTSNVTSMGSMFYACFALTNVDISNFNTSNVTSMHSMFSHCRNLKRLDLNNFDTSKVTTMYGMFRQCNELTYLDLTSFDTQNVTNMNNIFRECTNLLSIYVINGKWNTSKSSTSDMFTNCGTSEVTYL